MNCQLTLLKIKCTKIYENEFVICTFLTILVALYMFYIKVKIETLIELLKIKSM